MSKQEIVTVEEQLRRMREGYQARDLKLQYGGLEIPCRLITHLEEANAISNAKAQLKVPDHADRRLFESVAVMKAILNLACTVDATPYASMGFLDKLTSNELEALYDQYMTIKNTMDPKFETLSPEQVGELVAAVKKNQKTSSDFFTWQLAAIGRFFLDHLLPKDSVAGS